VNNSTHNETLVVVKNWWRSLYKLFLIVTKKLRLVIASSIIKMHYRLCIYWSSCSYWMRLTIRS